VLRIKLDRSAGGPSEIEGARLIPVLTIRDLEESSGVPRTTIHYYLSIGLLPRPQKTSSSRSLYTRDHLDILREIVELKQAGLALEEIQKQPVRCI
jgi:hypothetical protein